MQRGSRVFASNSVPQHVPGSRICSRSSTTACSPREQPPRPAPRDDTIVTHESRPRNVNMSSSDYTWKSSDSIIFSPGPIVSRGRDLTWDRNSPVTFSKPTRRYYSPSKPATASNRRSPPNYTPLPPSSVRPPSLQDPTNLDAFTTTSHGKSPGLPRGPVPQEEFRIEKVLEQAREDIVKLENKISQLHGEIKSVYSTVETKTKRLAVVTKQCDVLKNTLDTQMEIIRVGIETAETAKTKTRLESLETTNSSLQQQLLASKENARKQVEAMEATANDQKENAKKQFEALETTINDEKKSMQTKLDHVTTTSREELEALRLEVSDLQTRDNRRQQAVTRAIGSDRTRASQRPDYRAWRKQFDILEGNLRLFASSAGQVRRCEEYRRDYWATALRKFNEICDAGSFERHKRQVHRIHVFLESKWHQGNARLRNYFTGEHEYEVRAAAIKVTGHHSRQITRVLRYDLMPHAAMPYIATLSGIALNTGVEIAQSLKWRQVELDTSRLMNEQARIQSDPLSHLRLAEGRQTKQEIAHLQAMHRSLSLRTARLSAEGRMSRLTAMLQLPPKYQVIAAECTAASFQWGRVAKNLRGTLAWTRRLRDGNIRKSLAVSYKNVLRQLVRNTELEVTGSLAAFERYVHIHRLAQAHADSITSAQVELAQQRLQGLLTGRLDKTDKVVTPISRRERLSARKSDPQVRIGSPRAKLAKTVRFGLELKKPSISMAKRTSGDRIVPRLPERLRKFPTFNMSERGDPRPENETAMAQNVSGAEASSFRYYVPTAPPPDVIPWVAPERENETTLTQDSIGAEIPTVRYYGSTTPPSIVKPLVKSEPAKENKTALPQESSSPEVPLVRYRPTTRGPLKATQPLRSSQTSSWETLDDVEHGLVDPSPTAVWTAAQSQPRSSLLHKSSEDPKKKPVDLPDRSKPDTSKETTKPVDLPDRSKPDTAQETARPSAGFHIPASLFRTTMLASQNGGGAFWKHTLYQSPEQKKVTLHMCKRPEHVDPVAELFANETVLGFDLEWESNARPNVDPIKRNVAIIQLASESRIAVIQIAAFPGNTVHDLMPLSLRRILESPNIIKAGVNIGADFTRLGKCLDIRGQGIFELSHLYKVVQYSNDPGRIDRKPYKLAEQVKDILLLPMAKGSVRTSAWSKPLSMEQVEYAATDAYAGVILFRELENRRLAMDPAPPRPALYELGMPLVLGDGTVIKARTALKSVKS